MIAGLDAAILALPPGRAGRQRTSGRTAAERQKWISEEAECTGSGHYPELQSPSRAQHRCGLRDPRSLKLLRVFAGHGPYPPRPGVLPATLTSGYGRTYRYAAV
jgi:hypothetical protein